MSKVEIDLSRLTPDAREALDRIAEENALLRAALAEARARVGHLEEEGGRDPLTGLAGEQVLVDQVAQAVARAERHGTPAALITIDLKRLGEINRDHGRVAGDAALAQVGRMLRDLVRGTDLVTSTDGGFALLLDHLDADSAIETGDRIARVIAGEPLDLGTARVGLEVHVGVTTILPGDAAGEVLHRAARNRERVKLF